MPSEARFCWGLGLILFSMSWTILVPSLVLLSPSEQFSPFFAPFCRTTVGHGAAILIMATLKSLKYENDELNGKLEEISEEMSKIKRGLEQSEETIHRYNGDNDVDEPSGASPWNSLMGNTRT